MKQPGADALALNQAWLTWKEQVRPISECRAYMNDISCAQRLASINGCVPMRDRAGEAGLLARDGATATGRYETLSEGIAQKGASDVAADLGVARPVNTGVKALNACCIDINWYEQTFAAEAAKWCDWAGGKSIPPCPFTATPKKP